MAAPRIEPKVEPIETVVDRRGDPIEMRDDAALKAVTEVEQTVGVVGPTNWWRLGIVALVVVAAIILLLQLLANVPTPDAGTPPGATQSAPAQ